MRPIRRAVKTLLVLAALLLFFYWQNFSIQTEEVTVASPALPAAFDGLRVVEIADRMDGSLARTAALFSAPLQMPTLTSSALTVIFSMKTPTS